MIINPGMRRSGARRFSPAALFAASETGVWYDPSDLTTLFQDTAGTTPVTAVGQTVALMLDKSGRGNHATQATAAQRPTYRLDAGSRPYLEFDGVDDGMVTTSFSWPGLCSAWVGIKPGKITGIQVLATMDGGAGTSRLPQFFRLNTSNPESIVFVSSTAFTDTGPAVAVNTNYVISTNTAASQVNVRTNTVANSATAFTGTLNTSSRALTIGRFDAAFPGNYYLGNIYGLIIRGAATSDTQVEQTETWLNQRTGAY
jgi:hypothetical protein